MNDRNLKTRGLFITGTDTGAGDDAAESFMAFLKSPGARAIIERYGYGVPDEGA